ncbi:inorganic pyrophosphatase/manganese-dependent inorganic pyrophosphatase [Pseudomonas baetica]|uniref:Inorganic pyrophosphatase/manganese-dependent inorganic pyrophosphatase n=1 Tax=Pseudomonas baetica TaxID=674054 RepID=A0ABX4Q854_9PSED|nr:DHH family phosphoesterase [Pseudomonas baetica]PKA72925.1 inorganic pyrophosphatase/manganese-dependent inorganic pyrophosphatase [Pseudomonas baetica]PTC19075.1 DHH family protein [Pseudomonas baetica]
MKIITSGASYLDIDAYACCIAYAELLNLQGLPARAVSSAKPNSSVSPTVLSWGAAFQRYTPQANDGFVLVDVSDHHHFDPLVVLDQVVEVIDHHPGFEQYWAERLGCAADIRPIGAAATLVFQRWQTAGLLSRMSEQSAALLATAILDNTLNFTGQMTTELDVRAYDLLAQRASLAANWPERYFLECQAAIEADLQAALAADLKRFKPDSNLPQVFAQMTVWDADGLLHNHCNEICGWMAGQGDDWLLNVISIRDGKSCLLAEPEASQQTLNRLLPLQWQAAMAVVKPSMLRKELLMLGLNLNAV